MRITFAPRNILQIDDARIIYRNFAGRGDKYNREGDRNFALLITEESDAKELIERGWNVKVKPPKEDGDTQFMYLPVKVKFNDRGPSAYLYSGPSKNQLNENTIGMIDEMDILSVNLDIRPYDWEVSGKTGRTAYLQGIEVIQNVDRFTARYASEEYPGEDC